MQYLYNIPYVSQVYPIFLFLVVDLVPYVAVFERHYALRTLCCITKLGDKKKKNRERIRIMKLKGKKKKKNEKEVMRWRENVVQFGLIVREKKKDLICFFFFFFFFNLSAIALSTAKPSLD